MNSLVSLGDDKQYDMQFICLPYAGSISGVFNDWSSKLPRVEVCVAPYPDLDTTTTETVEYSSYFDQLVADCQNHIKKKFAIFGHSMGSILAYNLSKSLENAGLFPEFVIFSGSYSPYAVSEDDKKMHLLSNEELTIFLQRQSGSLDDKMIYSSYFMDVYLPKLRSDLKIMAECILDCQKKYDVKKALFCDIYAFGSLKDQDTTQELLNTWDRLTERKFYTKIFPGDHFYIHQYSYLLIEELNNILAKYF